MGTFIAIDLKSFYASVECVEMGLDPLTTNLVVADSSRTDKTICLAVSPSLKAYGISGRARLFEVVQRVRDINKEREFQAPGRTLNGSSENDTEVRNNPSLALGYHVAKPRMSYYIEYSTRIYNIYLKYIAPEDIHVYSIDEVFIEASHYMDLYGEEAARANMSTPHYLAMTMIRDVLKNTGITATAGIGTNLYLAKVAMDIVAKKAAPDKDGVRIAELDENSYRELLWCHRPLTDFWRIGPGIARRLEALGCYTMGDVARLSEKDEGKLYDSLGVNAELVIDHAWGWEPVDVATIKSYRPTSNSLSSGQVLMEPYDFDKAKLITREMTELLVLDLVKKGLVTKKIELTIGYDRTSIDYLYRGPTLAASTFKRTKDGKKYTGTVGLDHYGRPCPKHAHGTGNLPNYTSSTRKIMDCMMDLYDRIVDPNLTVRRVNVVAVQLIPEDEIPEEVPEQLSLFTDYAEVERQREAERKKDARERKIQLATLAIQERYGKNAMLKGINFLDGATTRQRNGQIGGHAAEQPSPASSQASRASQASHSSDSEDTHTAGSDGVDRSYGVDASVDTDEPLGGDDV